jgi:predicted transcriptional regulator
MPRRKRNDPDIHDSAIRADEALAEAIQMPSGPARNEALKKASQLRMAADKAGIHFAKRGRPLKTK